MKVNNFYNSNVNEENLNSGNLNQPKETQISDEVFFDRSSYEKYKDDYIWDIKNKSKLRKISLRKREKNDFGSNYIIPKNSLNSKKRVRSFKIVKRNRTDQKTQTPDNELKTDKKKYISQLDNYIGLFDISEAIIPAPNNMIQSNQKIFTTLIDEQLPERPIKYKSMEIFDIFENIIVYINPKDDFILLSVCKELYKRVILVRYGFNNIKINKIEEIKRCVLSKNTIKHINFNRFNELRTKFEEEGQILISNSNSSKTVRIINTIEITKLADRVIEEAIKNFKSVTLNTDNIEDINKQLKCFDFEFSIEKNDSLKKIDKDFETYIENKKNNIKIKTDLELLFCNLIDLDDCIGAYRVLVEINNMDILYSIFDYCVQHNYFDAACNVSNIIWLRRGLAEIDKYYHLWAKDQCIEKILQKICESSDFFNLLGAHNIKKITNRITKDFRNDVLCECVHVLIQENHYEEAKKIVDFITDEQLSKKELEKIDAHKQIEKDLYKIKLNSNDKEIDSQLVSIFETFRIENFNISACKVLYLIKDIEQLHKIKEKNRALDKEKQLSTNLLNSLTNLIEIRELLESLNLSDLNDKNQNEKLEKFFSKSFDKNELKIVLRAINKILDPMIQLKFIVKHNLWSLIKDNVLRDHVFERLVDLKAKEGNPDEALLIGRLILDRELREKTLSKCLEFFSFKNKNIHHRGKLNAYFDFYQKLDNKKLYNEEISYITNLQKYFLNEKINYNPIDVDQTSDTPQFCEQLPCDILKNIFNNLDKGTKSVEDIDVLQVLIVNYSEFGKFLLENCKSIKFFE
jgi:hypothetical protein